MARTKTKFKVFKGKGKDKTKMRGMDTVLFNMILVLLCFGLIMCFSASAPAAQQNMNGDSYYFLRKQLIWAIVGFAGMLAASKYDYHKLQKLTFPMVVLSFVLLIAVLFFPAQKGGRRWISLPGISFQPSEFVKFTVIVLFANMLSRKKWHKVKNVQEFFKYFMKDFCPYMLVFLLFALLLMLEPHFSCTVLILCVVMTMLFAAGANLGYFATIVGPVIAAGVALVSFGYRSDRITSYLDPFANPRGDGWQIIQSLYAIGSGGLFGLGLGQSRQKFLWLPEPYNDFIFAVLCEELGFIGAAAVLILFCVLIWRGIYVAMRAPDTFGTFVAVGITALIAFQVLINIAVVTKAIPVTGMPLPFFSSGGTALLFTLCEMGVLLNISRQIEVPEAK